MNLPSCKPMISASDWLRMLQRLWKRIGWYWLSNQILYVETQNSPDWFPLDSSIGIFSRHWRFSWLYSHKGIDVLSSIIVVFAWLDRCPIAHWHRNSLPSWNQSFIVGTCQKQFVFLRHIFSCHRWFILLSLLLLLSVELISKIRWYFILKG